MGSWREEFVRKEALTSGAGTILKVGGTGPKQKWGHRFFWSCLFTFGSKSTISRFGERFRDGQYSFISSLFAVLLLTVSPVLSHL